MVFKEKNFATKKIREKEILKEIYLRGIKAVQPKVLMKAQRDFVLREFEKSKLDKIIILGFGKASAYMSKEIEKYLKGINYEGIVITKYGYKNYNSKKIRIIEGGHPLPDEKGFWATKNIIDLIEKERGKAFFINLISGGGSSLLVYPLKGIDLKDKIKTTKILMDRGAKIEELNTVRKHLSFVKGGKLSKLIYPSVSLSLIISDVIGDKLEFVASGPTVPDKTTFEDAMGIIEKYKVKEKIPKNVLKILIEGIEGKIEENPKKGDEIFKKSKNLIIANNELALKEMENYCKAKGFLCKIVEKNMLGEAKEVGKIISKNAMEEKDKKQNEKPLILLFGGETTVKVKGKGRGGRAQELALSFLLNLKEKGIFLLSAGSDGTDGPTEATGAIVGFETLKKAKKLNLDPIKYLKDNNSYNFFKKTGDLFITGPTGTNVMDFYIILIN